MANLLLVDDDVGLCELLQEYLATEGFGVDAVHDGSSGLCRGCGGDYDLIILDVMLPDLGGFEVLRELRQSKAAPVLMLTARGDDVDRIGASRTARTTICQNRAIRANWSHASVRSCGVHTTPQPKASSHWYSTT